MKTFVLALLALAIAAPLVHAQSTEPTLVGVVSVGAGDRVAGSGRIVEERRALTGFSAVHVAGPIDIRLKASDHEGVIVRIDDNLVPLIETRVTGGERPALEIGVKADASFRASGTPLVVVEFRTLAELVIRGSGDVRADRIATEDFALSMSGSGDARIDVLQVSRFAAVLSGSGDLTVAGGRAEQQAYRLAGSGDVRASRLEGRGVQVAIAGSGNATVGASETLEATVAGSGDVTYRGNPRVTQRIRGSGTVHRAR